MTSPSSVLIEAGMTTLSRYPATARNGLT
jgi:hypothetical protein